jgi:branched-chain amino acid transport system permease protein
MSLQLAIKFALAGLLTGGVYGLIAIGLSLIFGVMGVINFAHGQMMVWGMYITYWLLILLGIEPYFSFLVSAAGLFAMGFVVQRLVVDRILDYPETMQVLPLIGLGFILENSALLFWGPDHRSPQTSFTLSTLWIGDVVIDIAKIIAFGIALFITFLLFLFLKKTDIGRAIRAAADNRLGANLVGINVDRINNISFGIGAASAGAAGTLLLPLMPLSPHLGHEFTLTAFVIVILGGLGSITGAMVGGIILGVAESLGTLFIPPSMKQVVSFTIMVIIILVRPRGLFGGKR